MYLDVSRCEFRIINRLLKKRWGWLGWLKWRIFQRRENVRVVILAISFFLFAGQLNRLVGNQGRPSHIPAIVIRNLGPSSNAGFGFRFRLGKHFCDDRFPIVFKLGGFLLLPVLLRAMQFLGIGFPVWCPKREVPVDCQWLNRRPTAYRGLNNPYILLLVLAND